MRPGPVPVELGSSVSARAAQMCDRRDHVRVLKNKHSTHIVPDSEPDSVSSLAAARPGARANSSKPEPEFKFDSGPGRGSGLTTQPDRDGILRLRISFFFRNNTRKLRTIKNKYASKAR